MTEETVTVSELAGWTPRQAEAIRISDQYQFTLFGGFRGPGKSYWLRWALLRQLLIAARDGIRGARAFLGCETFPVLQDRQTSQIEKEFPRWMGQVKATQSHGLGFHLKPAYGSGVLQLRNLDDIGKYIGAEAYAMGIDQIEKNPVGVFDALRGNLRWPGIERPRFMATANPGIGIGLPWVKALWVDRSPEARMEALLPHTILVEGRPGDNPHLDESYWEMLKTQPEHIRKAWLEGDWSVIEGAAFPEWQPRKDQKPWHVVPTTEVPRGYVYALGVDWGFSDPCAIYLLAIAHDGRVTICREHYAKQQLTSSLGAAMLRMMAEAKVDKGLTMAYVGFDAFAKRRRSNGEEDEPIVMTWQNQGISCVPAGRDPIFRFSKTREYLKDWGPDEGWPDGRPGLQVMACCQNYIRTIPMLQIDDRPGRQEHVNTRMEDHPYDGAGHVLTSLPARPTKEESRVKGTPRAEPVDEWDREQARMRREGERDEVHQIDDAIPWAG